jgi:hypothetical protein
VQGFGVVVGELFIASLARLKLHEVVFRSPAARIEQRQRDLTPDECEAQA